MQQKSLNLREKNYRSVVKSEFEMSYTTSGQNRTKVEFPMYLDKIGQKPGDINVRLLLINIFNHIYANIHWHIVY